MNDSPDLQNWPGAGELHRLWMLDPQWTYLNHGGFGACPRPVLEVQRQWQDRLESQPINFLARQAEAELLRARSELADFVGADADDLVFVTNATMGVNTVLRCLSFSPGDEIIIADHAYPAVTNGLRYVTERSGAKMVNVQLPWPLGEDAEQAQEKLVAAFTGKFTTRTRLLVLDHITSPSGIIMPVEKICAAAREKGIPVLVDGAHAPGMLKLNLKTLGATYYTGNCHKWICSPKGAGFLWVDPRAQENIVPLSLSLGWMLKNEEESWYQTLFKYTGTWDPSPELSVPAALDFFRKLPGGWEEVRRRNHELLLQARALLCEELNASPPVPAELLGSLATIPLPDGPVAPLEERLVNEFRIEVPVFGWPFRKREIPGPRLLRLSAQVYNDMDQYAYLASCLKKCFAASPAD